MAWVTGTAADQNDLLDKLVTFLSTDPTLVAAGQDWEVLRNGALLYTDTIAAGRIAWSRDSPNSVFPDPWPGGVQANDVRMKITGNLNAPAAGSYTFGVVADDMVEVRIDGALVYSQYVRSDYTGSFPNSFTHTLSTGSHTLDVRYIAFGGTYNFLSLGWQKPGDSSIAIIPATNFSSLSIDWNVLYDGQSGTAAFFDAAFTQKEAVVKGPGLSASDEIYVLLNTRTEVANDRYNLVVRGAAGFDNTLLLASQPGVTNSTPAALLWNQPMKYWFIASGRRFIMIAKVSTVYETIYAGFILPYALPTEIPYPLMIGANSYESQIRWSVQDERHSSIWRPASNSNSTANVAFRNTAGSWEYYANFTASLRPNGRIYPTAYPTSYRTDSTGSYALSPLTLYTSDGGGNVWGEMDGVFHVSGFANGSENIITIAGQDYLVVQGGFRTTISDYGAIALV